MPYSRLSSALKFRKELVDGCTCNGKNAFGTATISLYADITLRRGDVVATEKGLSIFVGSQTLKHDATEFIPIENYAGEPGHQLKELQAIRIRSLSKPEREEVTFNARVALGFNAVESRLVSQDVPKIKR